MMMSWGMMGWGMLLNMILSIVVIGFIIYGVLSLIAKALEKKEDPALQILKERFARGDISEEEFKQKSSFLDKK